MTPSTMFHIARHQLSNPCIQIFSEFPSCCSDSRGHSHEFFPVELMIVRLFRQHINAWLDFDFPSVIVRSAASPWCVPALIHAAFWFLLRFVLLLFSFQLPAFYFLAFLAFLELQLCYPSLIFVSSFLYLPASVSCIWVLFDQTTKIISLSLKTSWALQKPLLSTF